MKKRIFDIIISVFAIIILSPLFLLISIVIKLTSKGPIFFIQDRIGLKGSVFKIIKFRTMINDHNSLNVVSIKNDSRITVVGKILRKYKLDEIPELINVLFGSMSLVGPRPDVPGYVDLLKGENRKILTLKPGITGPASLKYFNEEEILSSKKNPKDYNDKIIFPDKVKINLDYYYKNNIWIDIKIIFATILKFFY
ncbi:MAG: sugar transferase [Flavobacteriales bacterium]|nr:sugar transferase [Flavobacteriales bacterium]|tara:strand:- start:411 stop:998 length:588 start_codon:yes stop_codon:yes gene_type:complete